MVDSIFYLLVIKEKTDYRINTVSDRFHPCPYPARDASRAWVRVPSECLFLLLLRAELPLILTVGISVRP
jgi:hypothetical protein